MGDDTTGYCMSQVVVCCILFYPHQIPMIHPNSISILPIYCSNYSYIPKTSTLSPHFPICSLLQSSSAFRKTRTVNHNNHRCGDSHLKTAWKTPPLYIIPCRVSEVSRAPSPWSHFHREDDFQLGFTFLRRWDPFGSPVGSPGWD